MNYVWLLAQANENKGGGVIGGALGGALIGAIAGGAIGVILVIGRAIRGPTKKDNDKQDGKPS
jgi:hypothetical protein